MKNQTTPPPHQKQVSLYKNFTVPYRVVTLYEIYRIICSGEFKEKIIRLRQLEAEGLHEEADALKKTLLGLSASCRCSPSRKTSNVVFYTGYVCIDLDHLSLDEMERIKQLLKSCPYVILFFTSPRGFGIKIFVETDSTEERHKQTYEAVSSYFERLLSIKIGAGDSTKIDSAPSSVVSLCFMSWDEDAYYNPEHKIFITPPLPPPTPPRRPRIHRPPVLVGSSDHRFSRAVGTTMLKRDFREGDGTARSGRNNFDFLLACNCRFFGLSESDTLSYILQHFGYDETEIKKAVRSAFRYKSL